MADTNTPVSDAEVYVGAWDWHMDPMADSNPTWYRLDTDDEGRFAIQKEVDFRISYLMVLASDKETDSRGLIRTILPTAFAQEHIIRLTKKGKEKEKERGHSTFLDTFSGRR
jgi:hypothetical protein